MPNPSSSGAAVTSWTILSELLAGGDEVHVVVLLDREQYDPTGVALGERIERVRALGGEVEIASSHAAGYFRTRPRAPIDRLRRAWRPADAELFPHLVDAPAVSAAAADAGADVAFVYHHEMLAASRGLGVPRFAAVGDPPQLSALYRFRELLPGPAALRRVVALQAQLRRQPETLVRLLLECERRGAFAAHHAAWLRRRGVPDCEYLRTPVPDPVGETWRAERDRAVGGKPRILLVGHMKGVVTLNGLRLFAEGILPRLERAFGLDGFEVRMLGGYDPPADLARLLDRPSVRLLGHVEEPDEEFKAAHALLVPNAISLGVRVRIVTAFSYGTCVVSHRANALGIPELEHGRNALMAGSAEELAQEVVAAATEESLRRRLEEGARANYERAFAPRVAVGRIRDGLEEIARAPAAA